MSVATPAVATSSGSTLWATASKEWVIQPKPKPGRKPKKEAPPKDHENEAKGRRIQNRAAQRAFRERKQSQLAELQARIQQYEQGEIERNVALQNIAKRLKEENEILRKENALLKDRVSQIEKDQHPQEKKRWRDNSPGSAGSTTGPAQKKSRVSPELKLDQPLSTSYIPSPPSMVNSPDSTGSSDTRFSPVYEGRPSATPCSNIPGISSLNNAPKVINLESRDSFSTFDCGFCSEDTPCVCRELAAQQAADRAVLPGFKTEDFTPNMVIPANRVVRLEPAPQPSPPSRPSILENLPAYQPPIPLRRRATAAMGNSVFPIEISATNTQSPVTPSFPMCSGDPSNCLACADDAFGKAFCSAVEKAVATRPPCVDCRSRESSFSRYCCGYCEGCPSTSEITPYDSLETMPTNDAWQQIKVHPNVSFADLSLLASVVVSSAKCAGPEVEPRPTPSSPPPAPVDNETIILTDPHAQYRKREKSQMQGDSSASLVRCGEHRIREVPTSAVRDALRLLDGKFS